MDCKNENGYCQKIHDKVGQKIFVDDRGCAKCQTERNGNPKMPGEVKPKTERDKAEQERLWEICELCDNDKCQRGRLDRRIRNGHCPENKWSK